MSAMPSVFIGHGSPMNALESNPYTQAWAAIAAELPRPRAILAVSAHWTTRGTRITAMPKPPTIHDFGGFPPALHALEYPAPGDPAMARQIADLLAPIPIALDMEWGLDHGTWSVLVHLYPNADVPVLQLSVDGTQPPEYQLEIGRRIGALRDEGVLVFGSGNIVHDLRVFRGNVPGAAEAAMGGEARISQALAERDDVALAQFATMGAVPNLRPDEHYWPVLTIAGTRRPEDAIAFPVLGTQPGMSMLAVRFG
jgi:4,5-DOPA dioxygenase extradiol